MRILAVAAVVAAVGLAASASAAGAPEIGGPPTYDFDSCDRELKPCGDPVVIGFGRDASGPVEIVAFRSRLGPCVEIATREGRSTNCGPTPLPPPGHAIFNTSTLTVGGTGAKGLTELSGALAPGVDEVRARYRRAGEGRGRRATVAQVDGAPLEEIGARRPFGVYVVTIRGCEPIRNLRLIALDASGEVLGRDRTRVRPGICGPPEAPGG